MPLPQSARRDAPFEGKQPSLAEVVPAGQYSCVPIPTFDKMLDPLLVLATKEALTRRTATAAMHQYFSLTEEERNARIPSGQSTVVGNRAGWAMTFLTKANLIEKVAPKTYRATAKGIALRAERPTGITLQDLRNLKGWREAWKSSKSRPPEPEAEGAGGEVDTSTATPAEALDNAVKTINADLKSRVLDAILAQTPEFFEKLVLDVLIAMGYGGSRADAAKHLGRSGDEGIDGRVNQDPLGLDQILVQAKQYAVDRAINRQMIQAFIGSMTGQGVTKGIFITTSSFNENAKEFVQRGSQTKVVLIDGDELLNLMLRHHIGVRVERQVEVLDVDQNYFSDDE
jgi:restriction system protein